MAAGPLAAHPPINQLIIHSLIYLGCSLSLSSSIQSTKEVSWLIERMEEESERESATRHCSSLLSSGAQPNKKEERRAG